MTIHILLQDNITTENYAEKFRTLAAVELSENLRAYRISSSQYSGHALVFTEMEKQVIELYYYYRLSLRKLSA